MLNVIMLNVVKLNAVKPNAIKPNAVKPNAVKLNAVKLNVVAPSDQLLLRLNFAFTFQQNKPSPQGGQRYRAFPFSKAFPVRGSIAVRQNLLACTLYRENVCVCVCARERVCERERVCVRERVRE
jgi:hypothetical protein